MKRIAKILASLSMMALIGCSNGGDSSDQTELQKQADKVIRGKNIRVVIGSKSTGGDTYQVSSIVSKKLGEVLGKNVKVDAVGAFDGLDAVSRRADGTTIMIFHDMAYLGYLYGKSGYVNIFDEFAIGSTLAVNPGNAFLAPKSSKYNTAEDVINAVGSGETVRVAIQPGSVSEIGYSAMKNAIKQLYPGKESNLVPINTGSQADKNQLLFDGQADVIHGSVQGNEQFTHLPIDDQKAMKFLWLTAKKTTVDGTNSTGFGDTSKEELLKFANPSVKVYQSSDTNFNFDKDFYMIYNKDTSKEVLDIYEKALAEAFQSEEFKSELRNAFFVPNYRNTEESNKYLKDKVATYKKIIESIK